MLLGWQNSSSCATSLGFPALRPWPRFGASLVLLWQWRSPASAAEKNGVWRLWPSVSPPLRPAAPTYARSLLWGHTRLSRRSPAQGPVFPVCEREKRPAGLAGRQPPVHQAVRLLRGPGAADAGILSPSQLTAPAGSGTAEGAPLLRLRARRGITDPADAALGLETLATARPHHAPLSLVETLDQLFMEDGLIG